MKADCYKCKWRGEVPGDAHSCCHHPAVGNKNDNPFGALVQMLGGNFATAAKKLNIKADGTGIRCGWFLWPANFDPVWLVNCDGFEANEAALTNPKQ